MNMEWFITMERTGKENAIQLALQVQMVYSVLREDLRPTVIRVNCQGPGVALFDHLKQLGLPVQPLEISWTQP